jgi:hypothetical protein
LRPTAEESLRGIQAALMEVIAPELRTAHAQSALETILTLLQSVIAELDTAVESLAADNREIVRLLEEARTAIAALPEPTADLKAALEGIGTALDSDAEGLLTISALSARNGELNASLERCIVALEGVAGAPDFASLDGTRADIYRHLRRVAARGWSVWDMLGFDKLVERARSGSGTG